MRKLTDIQDDKLANRLIEYLESKGIDAELRGEDGSCEVWIIDEGLLRRARTIASHFTENPDNPEFINITRISKPVVPQVRHIDVRTDIFSRPNESAKGKITIFLIIVCTALHLVTAQTPTGAIRMALYYSQYVGLGIPEILDGQVWRLVTPILMHGDFFHLLFNMIWLYQLGNQIETIKGSLYFSMMVILLAVFCNTAQFLSSGPAFLGMSGVVYGLLGFIWMHTRYEMGTRFELSQQTVIFMVLWMAACILNIIPSVANAQHVTGFAMGTLWGFLSSGGLKMWWRRRSTRRRFQ